MSKKLIPEKDLYELLSNLVDDKFGNINLAFANKRVLITGAAGFLGRAFLSYFKHLNETVLINTPVKIIAVDNFIVGSPNLDEFKGDKNVKTISHNVIEPIPGKHFSGFKRIDYLIGAAGLASPKMYRKFPEETIDVSVLGTKNLLRLANEKKALGVLTFSSSEVYNTPPDDQIPTPETYIGACPNMDVRSCYDIGKEILETISYVYHTRDNTPVVVVRPFNVYGCVHESDSRVLPNFIKASLKNESMKVYGDDGNTRTFCYITDALQGFVRLLVHGKRGQVYNIGNLSPEITIQDLALLIKEKTPTLSSIEVVKYPSDYPSTEPHRRCPNINKASSEVGYSPKISLADGIIKYYNWAKDNYFLNERNDTTPTTPST